MGVLGIEADGKIKGCPSLPTAAYTGGNIREESLHRIVRRAPELNFNQNQGSPESREHLWGFCGECKYGALCRGGCSWTAHVFFDRRGNNPYCHHRALVQASRQRRERVVLKMAAEGVPFDNGEFELIEEPLRAPWPRRRSPQILGRQGGMAGDFRFCPRMRPACRSLFIF